MTGSILTLLMLLAPITPESGRFTIRQNGETIATEQFTIRTREKGYVVEGRTEIKGDPSPLTSRMELDENLNPTAYEYTHGLGKIRVQIKDPVSELTVSEGAAAESSTDFRFPAGSAIVDNNFFHHYLVLLYRVKAAEQSFSVFVPQDMQLGQARVRATGARSYSLEVGDVKLQATVDANGRLQRLEVPDAKVVVER